MPKKTKKAKLRADTHRPLVSYAIAPHMPKKPSVPAVLHIEQTAIKQDIVKTIIWSTLIITIELLLSRYLH